MRVRELHVSYTPRSDVHFDDRTRITSPRESATLFRQVLGLELVEVFGILCLSPKHHVLCYHEVSRGTLDSTLAHPREIFRAAILANAASLIVGHNHPSGDPLPSADDKRLTDRLLVAGTLMGIEMLDHVIVTEDRYFSFREGGQL